MIPPGWIAIIAIPRRRLPQLVGLIPLPIVRQQLRRLVRCLARRLARRLRPHPALDRPLAGADLRQHPHPRPAAA